MSHKPHLYGYFFSSASLRVVAALHLKGIDFDYTAINLKDGEEYSAEFSKINPLNSVPVLEHSGNTITQSVAILEYLEETFPDTQKLLPEGVVTRAYVRSLVNIIACDIHPIDNLRVLKKLGDFGVSLEDARGEKWYHHWVINGFKAFETHLEESPRSDFCYGNTPTLADVCLIPQVHNANRFGVQIDSFPNIQRIFNNCMALEAFQQASPLSQIDSP
jgi:maleylacetoacetate isomerase